MTTVEVSNRAWRDLDRLAAWLRPRSARAAETAADALEAGIASLTQFPDRGAPLARGVRELFVPFGRDGYIIRYRVKANRVLILRLWHSREDRGRKPTASRS